MNKFLPKSAKNPQGFTLVELLVVVSIIGILSVVGVTVFTGVQKNARDARRKADIESISKSMETNYNEQTGVYVPLALTMFASNTIPTDPAPSATCLGNPCRYCVKGSTANCGADLTAEPTVAVGQPAGGSSYRICANLEAGTPTYFCRSAQR